MAVCLFPSALYRPFFASPSPSSANSGDNIPRGLGTVVWPSTNARRSLRALLRKPNNRFTSSPMTENQNDLVDQMQAAMRFFIEMQKPAQEAMKLFADTQLKFFADAQRPAQEAMKVFAELQKPALEGMKAFAELQNAAQQAMKAFAEMQNSAQEAMKAFTEMQKPAQEAMKLFTEMQKPAIQAMSFFADMQKPTLEAMKFFAEFRNPHKRSDICVGWTKSQRLGRWHVMPARVWHGAVTPIRPYQGLRSIGF